LFDGDVDILINNAGVVAQHRTDTVDGFETMMGTNFLGPFALTNLLFSRIRSQIINVGSDAHRTATIAFDDPHLRVRKWSALSGYGRSKLAVMLWGLELDRRLRVADSPVSTFLTHPGWVASNLSNVSDDRLMAAFHTVVQASANVLANDIDAGAAPTLYCITEPIPPGSYVGIDSRWGLKGGPTLSGRAAVACDYADALRLWEFAERETGTTLPL
jgi:NAD(P)-dependent dehydrogenase (short-subunit alcohol dehydrogenase family)